MKTEPISTRSADRAVQREPGPGELLHRNELIPDVLVVGAGPGGLATALSAARHGARVLVVDRRPGTSTRPRATGINLRTMEILRTWGVADAVRARAIPVDHDTATAATLVAPPVSVGRAGGYPDLRELVRASPALPLACPQDVVEPILADAVRRLGGEIRFGARLTDLAVAPDGVRAVFSGGARVRARFVVGADGTRSTVRAALGIGTTHLGTFAEAVQVLFHSDLTRRLGRLPHVVSFVTEPAPAALCPMGDGRWSWVGLGLDGRRPEIPADWTFTLRAATGVPDLEPEVLDVARFTLAAAVATRYRSGPGFLVGDAAHRTTPIGGIGLNTAVHDGHELGWKLAWAVRGLAGEALLDSHDAERGPVGLGAALRSLDLEGRPTDGLAINLGHTHRSAVIAGTDPAPELRTDLAARPGERAPHAWVRPRVSTLDLFDGRLTLVTGDDAWTAAARTFDVAVVGATGGSALAAAYRTGPGSAVLVRPDGRVSWRADAAVADPRAALADAVATTLGHAAEPAALAG